MILIAHMPDSCPREEVAARAAVGDEALRKAETVLAVWEDRAMVLKQPNRSVILALEVTRVDGPTDENHSPLPGEPHEPH